MKNAIERNWRAWLVLLWLTITVAALADSAFLTLSGTVTRTVSLTLTPLNNYSSLDLASGERDKAVAVINERCNERAGYQVILSSTRPSASGQLVLTPGNPANLDAVPYTLKYGGAPVLLQKGRALLSKAASRTPAGGTNTILSVTIAPPAALAPDSYSDTLRITIEGN
jgi:hypothetical protein